MKLLIVLLIVVLVLPFVVYQCMKLGTYAYFQGKSLFEREKRNGEK